MATAPKRFAHYTDEELAEKQADLQNQNTLKNEIKADRLFRKYLTEVGVESDDFYKYTEQELDKHLSKFWFAARKTNNEEYKVGSLITLRYGLNRALKRSGCTFDITKKECTNFTKSIKAFEDACVELKKHGKGYVDSYKQIHPKDMQKFYSSSLLDPEVGPKELQNKVRFDIRFYFARRGAENMYDMKKDDFKLFTDKENDFNYIMRVTDEETKNHKEYTSDIDSCIMPEIPNNKMCPVQSFLTYIYSLDKSVDYLWQQPKMKKFPANGKGVWYGPGRVGHNSIETFISKLALKLDMKDEKYTNHSLRHTGINALSKTKKYNNKELMFYSGHKSESSLGIYQKVDFETRLNMGRDLNCILQDPVKNMRSAQQPQAQPLVPIENPQQNLQLAPVPNPPVSASKQVVKSVPNVTEENAIIPFEFNEDIDPNEDLDLLKFITEVENQNQDMIAMSQVETKTDQKQSVSRQQQIMKRPTPQLPTMFSGCTIHGNITINLPK